MNFVESFNLLGVEAKQIPCIKGDSNPTTTTYGDLGCLYINTNTGELYKCIASENGVYTWVTLDYTTIKSTNLFNKASEDIVYDTFLAMDGSEVALARYFITHAIPTSANKQYVATFSEALNPSSTGCVYNENGEFVDCIHTTVSADGRYVTFTIPNNENIAFMRLNGHYDSGDVDAFMAVEGSDYPNEYIPHSEKYTELKNEVRLAESQIAQVNEALNPLCGKKISLNGDSICWGAGASGGYGKIIADKNGMSYQNIGVSGATIATGTVYNGVNRHWICETIDDMDESADFAIVEGGVNDAGEGIPLGEISSYFGNTFDTTTFYGAFEYMLSRLTKRFAGKKIGYIAVHKMVDGFLSRPIYSTEKTDYYDAAKKCCEKWGVPFLDLNNTVPPFAYFSEAGDAELNALKIAYTINGDGWHPNEEGYKKYYVPKIEAWLKTL